MVAKSGRSIARVEVAEVTRLFGATPILRGVNATFSAGSITVIRGGNGAGKSTLLSVIGTRLRPSRGSVEYFDAAGESFETREVRAELGWVSHETMAYRELTGFENVRLVAELTGSDPGAVARVAHRTKLGKYAERPLSTLSRGQKQRVALARALVHEPTLLLLDEPWTGLDEEASRDLERIVLEERERKTTIILVSHDPKAAARLGARTLFLERGRLSERSEPDAEESSL